ncbi:MAG: hypothetical protein ABH824_01350 [Nanoarchaeota archaeon]|nr:hypothetical protein [Nanoarchaeota archaeon]MBU1631931.1 hypothetical protein [Nanoarchaeota archaeon]MBU1876408.1 hypothetical protein [Nanoarchaeota archaeon]
MQKRGQLGIIEFKYFIIGLLIGLIGGLTLIFLGTKKILPFSIPLVCGSIINLSDIKKRLNKKGQLGMIEFQYFIVGLVIGVVLALVLVFLGTKAIIPNFFSFLCPAKS